MMTKIMQAIEDIFVKSRWMPGLFHLAMFISWWTFLLAPLFLPEPPEGATIFNNFTVIANFSLWVIWWPMLLLSMIFFGRAWCGMCCPLGALSEFMDKLGGRAGKIPKWMQAGFIPLFVFIFITIWGHWVGVDEFPKASVEVLGTVAILSMLTGYFFARRPWCRYLCPIGMVLGVFSRLGAM